MDSNGVNLDLQIDMTDVPDVGDFETVPDGDYHVVVTQQQWGTSKNGNTKLEFEVEVISGDHAGFKMVDTLTFTTEGLKRVRCVLIHLGDFDMANPRFSLRQVQLVGKQAIARIKLVEDTYNGATYKKNKVDFNGYFRADGFQYVRAGGPMQQQPPVVQQPAAATPPPPPMQPPMQLSPDGQFAWNGASWIPNPQLAPPPPPAPMAPPAAPNGYAPPRPDGLPF